MQLTCPHLAPILPRCAADLAHCIRLHNFVAGGRGERGLLGLRRYSRAADVNNLRRNESWPTATAAAEAATSTRRPRQSGRNISRKSRFSTQDLFGATEWECEQARVLQGEVGEEAAAASCAGGFALGSASISHFHKFRIAALYDSCARFSIESEEFAWRDLREI